ncbi:MAG: SsrA-binding protein SmpB [Gammaproteobacteria bacterium]|nr:SsrA-binding protein SmpB [Gammaproteobacteria bacterium]MBI5614879.1 SsrA-binding protein SmpB [Gammaproteobacteria bacterium]
MSTKKKAANSDPSIAQNRKAFHDYFIEERLEGGLVLEGWEVKSLRAGKAQLRDSYVLLKGGEAFLLGLLISPLNSASTHVEPDPTRIRKLLLHEEEIARLVGAVERKGYSVIALSMYWKRGRAKVELGLAKGKKQHDKREAEKDRDWARDRERLMKHR